jgi:hypothetical protein
MLEDRLLSWSLTLNHYRESAGLRASGAQHRGTHGEEQMSTCWGLFLPQLRDFKSLIHCKIECAPQH